MLPIKNLENISSQRIKKKTKITQDCIIYSAHSLGSRWTPCTLNLSSRGVCSPWEKLGPACSFLISSQKFVFSRVTRIGTRKGNFIPCKLRGLWEAQTSSSPLCHSGDSMLPVCVQNFLAFNYLPFSAEEGNSLETQVLENGNSIIDINVFILCPFSIITKCLLLCFWFVILLATHLTQVRFWPFLTQLSFPGFTLLLNKFVLERQCSAVGKSMGLMSAACVSTAMVKHALCSRTGGDGEGYKSLRRHLVLSIKLQMHRACDSIVFLLGIYPTDRLAHVRNGHVLDIHGSTYITILLYIIIIYYIIIVYYKYIYIIFCILLFF